MTEMPASLRGLHIGLDLDNTLIIYDRVFSEAVVELGLLPSDHGLATKTEIKSALISRAGNEDDWMRLQGQVYGRFIGRAILCPGAGDFLRMARGAGARLSIVSHKTRFGHFDPDRVDLWDAALGWLQSEGFFDAHGFGLDPADVHFRETRAEKIAQIATIGCEVFVDDLAEVLLDESFPAAAQKIWFNSDPKARARGSLTPRRSWAEIAQAIAAIAENGKQARASGT